MCGRLTQFTDISTVASRFEVQARLVLADDGPPRYNVAPSTSILVVRAGEEGQRELVRMKWGLVPHWSVEPKTSYSTSNARAETVDSKPVFRAAFKHRRCLIPANGWYEWQILPEQKYKQPWYYRGTRGDILAFAGLWERWEHAGQVLESCTIIVTGANAVTRPVHDRMPVILGEDAWARLAQPANARRYCQVPVTALSRRVGDVISGLT